MVKQRLQIKKILTGFLGFLICTGVVRANPDVTGSYGMTETEITSPQQSKITVKGNVSDNIEPVIGASVVEKGTTNGAITDMDGNFSIQVSSGAILIISYVGYTEQQVPVDGRTNINILMVEDMQALDEVVVVGYGVQKKVNLTGSVASVGGDKLESRPLTNLSSGLGGLLPGVQTTQSSGKPGSDGGTIRIRGGLNTLNSSAPLIIIDGIEGNMDAINAVDVESVNVLKDAASAAIYGARAANGVVLITTKKGTKERTVISLNSNFSIAQPAGIKDYINDFVTYMNIMNTAKENSGSTAIFGETDFKNWEYANAHPNELNEHGIPLSVAYPNTDWYDVIMKDQWSQNYNLSARGGSEKINYNLSLGYLNNPGIMDNSGLEQFNARANIEVKMTKFLSVGTQTWFMKRSTDLGDTSDAFSKSRSSSPAVYPKYGDLYGSTAAAGDNQQSNNPLYTLHSAGGFNDVNRVSTTWYAKFDILKGLNFETKFNYTYSNQEQNKYTKQLERYNFATNQLTYAATSLDAATSYFYYNRSKTLTVENLINYHTKIAQDHSLFVLLGHNEFSHHNYNFSATGRGLIDISLLNLSSTTEPLTVTGSEYDNAMRSFFGRINYDYKNKYLFEANLRYDGSSKFASGKRWGLFPSFSAGWRLEQEEFMPDAFMDFFQSFKIRGSWGQLGNNTMPYTDSIEERYLFMNKYQQHSEGNYSFGGNAATGLIVKALGNSSLKWESTRVWGAAIDATFFDQRASVSVEYYDKYTDGILYRPTMNGIMGNKSAPVMNLAEVSNKGFEASLGWNDNIRDFRYAVGVNFNYTTNKVEKYKGQLIEYWDESSKKWVTNFGDVANGSDNVIVEGHRINEHRVLKVYKGDGSYYNADGSVNINGGPKTGMIRTPEDLAWINSMLAAGYTFNAVTAANVGKKNGLYYGDLIYADLNGDGKYGDSSTDRYFTGTSTAPKWNLGMNLSAEYKGFDFSTVWMGLFGAKLWACEDGTNNHVLLEGGKMPLDVVNNSYFYDPENPGDSRTNINAKYPRLRTGSDSFNKVRSDFWLTSGSFLRMKNIQIGYTLPKNLLSPLAISSLRVFVSGENLITITPYEGMDPEAQTMSGYPTLKQYAVGFSLNF